MIRPTRTYDIVIFGASGSVGKYLVRTVGIEVVTARKCKWAIAGRRETALRKVLRRATAATGYQLENVDVLTADAQDYKSLLKMCNSTKLIACCVDSLTQKGEKLIEACLEAKTHYVDCSKDALFLERVQLLYHQKATKQRVYIIPGCGFEPLIYDFGVLFLQTKFKGTLNSCEVFQLVTREELYQEAGLSHWINVLTLAVNIMDYKRTSRRLRKELYSKPMTHQHLVERRGIFFSNPFPALFKGCCVLRLGPNLSTVRRTQSWNYNCKARFPTQIHTYIVFGHLYQALLYYLTVILVYILSAFRLGRYFLHYLSKLKRGAIKQAVCCIYFCGSGWSDVKDYDPMPNKKPDTAVTAKFTGINPKYGLTPKLMALCSFYILDEIDNLPGSGGVLTPVVAFENTSLLNKINSVNSKYEIMR